MAGLSDPYTILRVGPQTFTSQHIDNTNSPKWEEMYEVRKRGRVLWCRWYRRWNTQSFPFYFVLYLRDWTLRVLGMSIFIHGNMRPQPASIQVPVSLHVLVCVCLVRQVIVHEVPGQELEVEVYDKDPDQDDFLGRYIWIVHVSCVPMLNLTLSPFICHLSWPVGQSTLPFI